MKKMWYHFNYREVCLEVKEMKNGCFKINTEYEDYGYTRLTLISLDDSKLKASVVIKIDNTSTQITIKTEYEPKSYYSTTAFSTNTTLFFSFLRNDTDERRRHISKLMIEDKIDSFFRSLIGYNKTKNKHLARNAFYRTKDMLTDFYQNDCIQTIIRKKEFNIRGL
jgi:hypothetical protein